MPPEPFPLLPSSDPRQLLLWLLRRRRRFRITGNSMLPTLQPGQEVLMDPRAYESAPPQVGDVVVAQHPYRPQQKIVKRVCQTFADGRCLLEGDNPVQSTDSRIFGSVDKDLLLGKVVCRFP